MDDTKLNVLNENGEYVEIDVIDIFSAEESDKEFIIYSVGEDVYSSVLVENENSFELKLIDDAQDLEAVTKRINELVA